MNRHLLVLLVGPAIAAVLVGLATQGNPDAVAASLGAYALGAFLGHMGGMESASEQQREREAEDALRRKP